MNVPYEELFDSSVTLKQNEWTQDALQEIPTCKGVLLFVDQQNQPIQIIQTGNLRRAVCARLLQKQTETSRKTDIATLSQKIFWASCHSNFMTQVNYLRLAHTLYAETANNWIQLPTPFFAVIDLDAPLPYFYISNDPVTSGKRIAYGLFPNRKTVQEFTETLNTVFCLCRNPSLLKTPRRSSCPYFQMQKCPGPCLDSSQKQSYLNRVHKAIAGANGHTESANNMLNQMMNSASNSMDFEKANELKRQIDQLKKLEKSDYRWVHDLKDLTILHVDESFRQAIEGKKRKVRYYKWLKIVSDGIYDLGDFLPDSDGYIERFLEQKWTTAPRISYASDIKEHLGNVAYFLFRSKQPGFWLDCTEGIDADRLYSGLDTCLKLKEPLTKKKDTEQNSVSQKT
ncbi:MAG: UvrB/UvrC motif-containing protein [Planctomycetota bacterium]|jgi:hypothetical protein